MENNGRPYFPFMRSYYEAIEQCPKEVQLEVYRAIALYGLDKIEPDMSALANILWTLIKPTLDKMWTKYNNGKNGGAPSESLKGNRNAKKETENEPNSNRKRTENEPTQSKDKDIEDMDKKETTYVAKKGELSLVLPSDSRYIKFNEFLKKECPSVAKMKNQLSEADFHKLMERFNGNGAVMAECFRKLDNSPKGTKNKDVYRTMLEWDRNGYFDAIRKEKGGEQ